jgi:hypothetical protein
MCTLSFLPKGEGYLVAMNRDELLNREIAQPPLPRWRHGVFTLFPTESYGGTWIAANEFGLVLAILNLNEGLPSAEIPNRISRGVLIPKLIDSRDLDEMTRKLQSLALKSVRPFRLVAVSPLKARVREWRWNGIALSEHDLQWVSHHWYSSSISDQEAELRRARIVLQAAQTPCAGTVPWLRELHSSHSPAAGPFSLCVHRAHTATVSYTEIACTGTELKLSYRDGSPCASDRFTCHFTVALGRYSQPIAA